MRRFEDTAMMVHFEDALVAYAAVVSTRCFRPNALLAYWSYFRDFLWENVHVRILRNKALTHGRRGSWIGERCFEIVEDDIHKDPVSEADVVNSPRDTLWELMRQKTRVKNDHDRGGQADDQHNKGLIRKRILLIVSGSVYFEDDIPDRGILQSDPLTTSVAQCLCQRQLTMM